MPRRSLGPTSFAYLVSCWLGGCSVADAGRGVEDGAVPRGPTVFTTCDDAHPPEIDPEGFRHFTSTVLALTGAWHEGDDAIGVPGEDVVLRAKFSYGPSSKDLEDEWIDVWLDGCDGLEWIGAARTDDDGRIALRLVADDLPVIGRHDVHFVVAGDGTTTSAALWVLPQGTRVAVFDIDGTLTASDWELFEDLVDDLYAPLVAGKAPATRKGAAEITQVRAAQGYVPIYLTGRPYWLAGRTRAWLADRGMAPGALFTARRTAQLLPTEAGVGTFKADLLADLELLGLGLDVAYGNAATDIYAYGEAGIDPHATFIVGRHGGEHGTVDLGEGYTEHLAGTFAPIEQPFLWP